MFDTDGQGKILFRALGLLHENFKSIEAEFENTELTEHVFHTENNCVAQNKYSSTNKYTCFHSLLLHSQEI